MGRRLLKMNILQPLTGEETVSSPPCPPRLSNALSSCRYVADIQTLAARQEAMAECVRYEVSNHHERIEIQTQFGLTLARRYDRHTSLRSASMPFNKA